MNGGDSERNRDERLDKLQALITEDFPDVPNAKLESMGINGDIGQIIQLLKKDKCY